MKKPGKVYAKQESIASIPAPVMGRPKTGRRLATMYILDPVWEMLLAEAQAKGCAPRDIVEEMLIKHFDRAKV